MNRFGTVGRNNYREGKLTNIGKELMCQYFGNTVDSRYLEFAYLE